MTTLMPEAQKRGSSSAPGISLRNASENSPKTVEQLAPAFSKTRPSQISEGSGSPKG